MNIHQHLHLLDFGVVVVYLLLLVGIGAYISFRKQKSSERDYFLAGGKLRWYSIGLTMWGTNVGPSMLIASCAVGYTTGIVAGNFSWYAFVFIGLLALVFAPHYKNTGVSTLPEFMGKRFNATTREMLAWYSLVTILISWLGLTLYAGGLLVNQIMDWPLWASVSALMLLATFFAVAGGLEAIAITNVFQMILLIVASSILVIAGIYKLGGIDRLLTELPADYGRLLLPADNPDYPWIAIILGYPVLGIWFWCTDQSMVQSVLGAKNLEQGQLGTNLTGWLKIIDVPLFILPGIIAYLLYPNLPDENEAYMTLVTGLLPVGMVGLIMAVLIAALVSTIDSALNSLSTVFTIDIYARRFRPDASPSRLVAVGRTVVVLGAVGAILIALGLDRIKGMDLFSLFQAILGYLAPPMAAVFLLGVTWKRMTTPAANVGLVVGSIVSLAVGVCQLRAWPSPTFWPHFLLVSFFLFVFILILMVGVSLATPLDRRSDFPTLTQSYAALNYTPSRRVLWLWGGLSVVMLSLYLIFN
ncbi:sodium:solute symporter family transporter [Telluribacter sp.]|jgi:SSS family solute:Na+ symporter|uniref:sodium:solute symporter family transporter n=1 Tax=Telluribacter sp. TaxID=1978767 RepID=UPI002E1034BD|nr:sodium/solute symporter [Telluribacter sp.]HEV7347352.1 sodium/solute symporter [Telluribacter sp.]